MNNTTQKKSETVLPFALISQTGMGHVYEKKPCEDYALCFQTGSVRGAVLADGAGSCKLARETARSLCHYFAERPERELLKLFSFSAVKLREKLQEHFTTVYQLLGERYSARKEEIGSTFILVLEAKDSENWLLVHCADGAVFGITADQSSAAQLLSHPDVSPIVTPFDQDNISRMRVLHFRKDEYQGVVLGSDGGIALYINPDDMTFAARTVKALFNKTMQQGQQYLTEYVNKNHNQQGITDDVTLLIYRFNCWEKKDLLVTSENCLPFAEKSELLVSAESIQKPDMQPSEPAEYQQDSSTLKRRETRKMNKDKLKKTGKIVFHFCCLSLIFWMLITGGPAGSKNKTAIADLQQEIQEIRSQSLQNNGEVYVLQERIKILEIQSGNAETATDELNNGQITVETEENTAAEAEVIDE